MRQYLWATLVAIAVISLDSRILAQFTGVATPENTMVPGFPIWDRAPGSLAERSAVHCSASPSGLQEPARLAVEPEIGWFCRSS